MTGLVETLARGQRAAPVSCSKGRWIAGQAADELDFQRRSAEICSLLRRDTPENLWVKCPESGQLVFHKDLEANLMVVPGSGYHMAIGARARLASLFDGGDFEELMCRKRRPIR